MAEGSHVIRFSGPVEVTETRDAPVDVESGELSFLRGVTCAATFPLCPLTLLAVDALANPTATRTRQCAATFEIDVRARKLYEVRLLSKPQGLPHLEVWSAGGSTQYASHALNCGDAS